MPARTTPKRVTYGDLFAPWEVTNAEYVVSHFHRTTPCLQDFQLDDLRQDVLTHWCRVRDGYRAKRGASQKTFMTRVVRTKLLEIIRSQETDLRRVNHEAMLFSDQDDADLAEGTLGDTAEDAVPDRDGDAVSMSDCRIDLATARESLTGRDRRVFDLLAGGIPKTKIAEELNVHRETVDASIERIRMLFEDKGLRDYLR